MTRAGSLGGGPCAHCAAATSPCWRRGPPEKPVLCNACGSRYLVKKSLVGYQPGSKKQSSRFARHGEPRAHDDGRPLHSPSSGVVKKKRTVPTQRLLYPPFVVSYGNAVKPDSPNQAVFSAKVLVDRGTQTCLPLAASPATQHCALFAQTTESLAVAAATGAEEGMRMVSTAEAAVSTLALLRQSSGSDESGHATEERLIAAVRRPRKPPKPSVLRTLF